ncbi:hypothetical protein BV25DRAFT_1112882 [Artomyces pyxidatus]|uniref:Uncharacterized protein n=1 Tax=Artomyces pyxidatus TaxID=48021 RepID=A0ACB8TGE3_9AGAM|nr:hypothetical protein BV25DRAFT_1112882 [Artomyces pyxidatus]
MGLSQRRGGDWQLAVACSRAAQTPSRYQVADSSLIRIDDSRLPTGRACTRGPCTPAPASQNKNRLLRHLNPSSFPPSFLLVPPSPGPILLVPPRFLDFRSLSSLFSVLALCHRLVPSSSRHQFCLCFFLLSLRIKLGRLTSRLVWRPTSCQDGIYWILPLVWPIIKILIA